MSAVNPDEVAKDQLRSFMERLESLDGEIRDLNRDKSEVFKEARGNGFDVSVLRKLLSERRDPSKAAEQRELLELYRDVLSRVHAHARAA